MATLVVTSSPVPCEPVIQTCAPSAYPEGGDATASKGAHTTSNQPTICGPTHETTRAVAAHKDSHCRAHHARIICGTMASDYSTVTHTVSRYIAISHPQAPCLVAEITTSIPPHLQCHTADPTVPVMRQLPNTTVAPAVTSPIPSDLPQRHRRNCHHRPTPHGLPKGGSDSPQAQVPRT
jgi:hypothetical protein